MSTESNPAKALDRELEKEPESENVPPGASKERGDLRRVRYHFKSHEKVSHGVKRMAIEQIDEALDRLGTSGQDVDAAIHDSRVCFKKIRALLRLVHREIGNSVFKEENVLFRDAGRRLSAVRDSVVVVETFDKLASETSALATQSLEQMRTSLVRAERTPAPEKEKALSDVAAIVKPARERVQEWTVDHQGFSALGPGLRIVYRHGRASLDRALSHPTTENLHELRKRVKDLWYQIHVLAPAWPEVLKCLAGQLEELAHLLSANHDLAVLREAVSDVPGIDQYADDLERILTLVDCRRKELRMEAMPLGERIYAEKPASFVQRIEGYWSAWRPKVP